MLKQPQLTMIRLLLVVLPLLKEIISNLQIRPLLRQRWLRIFPRLKPRLLLPLWVKRVSMKNMILLRKLPTGFFLILPQVQNLLLVLLILRMTILREQIKQRFKAKSMHLRHLLALSPKMQFLLL